MSFEIPKRHRGTVQSLNVIPFVDILFLLIVFFSLMGQLLETEAPAVSLPDGCDFAVVRKIPNGERRPQEMAEYLCDALVYRQIGGVQTTSAVPSGIETHDGLLSVTWAIPCWHHKQS